MRRSRSGVVALLAVSVVAAGCGGSSPREQADAYVRKVNAVQATSAPAFKAANRAYARFVKGKLAAAEAVRRLAAAETAIRSTEARLKRVPAPPVARTLRAKLLRVYSLNAGLAHETVLLARYTPARTRALRPVVLASGRLSTALRHSTQPAEQAAAFAAYGRTLGAATARLRKLHPPPIAAAANRQELRRLTTSAHLADSLRAAVLARDPARTARLVAAFKRAGGLRPGERSAQVRELTAYTARRRAISRAVGDVQRERARLDRL